MKNYLGKNLVWCEQCKGYHDTDLDIPQVIEHSEDFFNKEKE